MSEEKIEYKISDKLHSVFEYNTLMRYELKDIENIIHKLQIDKAILQQQNNELVEMLEIAVKYALDHSYIGGEDLNKMVQAEQLINSVKGDKNE